MSDPLDPLREAPETRPPDVAEIRARAERLTSRRRAIAGGAAVLLVAAGIAGVVLSPSGIDEQEASRIADEPRATITSAAPTGTPPAADAQDATPSATAQATARTGAGGALVTDGHTTAGGQSTQDASALTVRLETSAADPSGRSHEFTADVCNETDRDVNARFSSAQRYDFTASRDGEVMWRWSWDKSFAQIQGTETWSPGDCRSWTESWSGGDDEGGHVPPGTYEIVAVLTSSPSVVSGAEKVCFVTCDEG